MANIISIQDFKGAYALGVGSDSYAQKPALEAIQEWEPKYLSKILGFALKDDFYASNYVTGGSNTPTPEMVVIYDPIEQEDPCFIQSEGLKVTLCKLIYLHIVRSQMVFNTVGGNKNLESNASTPSKNIEVTVIYNQGVKSAHAIQQYCRENTELYPTYKGRCLQYTSFI